MSNDLSNAPVPPPPPPPSEPMMTGPTGPRPMFQTWIDAVTKPSQSTYSAIANSPQASSTTALVWVFLAALVEFFISILVGQIGGAAQRGMFERFGFGQNLPVPGFGSRILQVVCGAPIAAVIVVLWFALMVGVAHLIAKAFGGKGTFNQLAYVFAAIFVPVALVSTVIALLEAIPVLGFAVAFCFIPISLALAIYVAVIEIIATMAVHQIGGGQATVSVLALPVVFCLCLACIAIIGFAAFGATIGNVFSGMGPFPIPTPAP